ncbi:hypothetical protein QG516_20750 [Pedobacter gandavensis]|uniref:hypothetical protein n=1 Tax=Pedobacter gandavensis TaxID=2679963 RepID=UPI00247AAEE9|nr:hypothetical protein [Pedobacter gandavensis]WGQ08945.1 hypothetical protein QG516_20750 [Pedobacter gandavensis]
MKHIKKKFLGKVQLPKGGADSLNELKPATLPKHNDLDEMVAWGLSENDEFISMFQLKDGNKTHLMPEPDLVICMFEMGRQNTLRIPELRKKLLASLHSTHDTFVSTNNFYAATSIAAISLINALESYINRIIPNDFKYEIETNKNTTIQNKKQLERNVSFEEKIKDVIPKALGKIFHTNYPSQYNSIIELKKLRDEMTHMKSYNETKKPLSYAEIYNMAFKIDYLKALNSVKTYINYYTENLIEACPCDNDF